MVAARADKVIKFHGTLAAPLLERTLADLLEALSEVPALEAHFYELRKAFLTNATVPPALLIRYNDRLQDRLSWDDLQ